MDNSAPLQPARSLFISRGKTVQTSGATSVITADFGTDLALIIRAAKESGLNKDFFTLNAHNFGVPSAMGAAGEGRVKLVSTFNPNDPKIVATTLMSDFKRQFNEDFINGMGYHALYGLALAIREAKSTDPVKVAAKLEGLRFEGLNGPFEFRREDHQGQQPLFIQSWEKVDNKTVVYDQENTGLGWKQIGIAQPQEAALPSSCKMVRPRG